MDNVTLVAITEAIDKLKEHDLTHIDLKEKLKIAMKKTKNHWLQTNKEEQLLAAINAVLSVSNEHERKILRDNVEELRAFSTASQGVPVDLNKKIKPSAYIAILDIWEEI